MFKSLISLAVGFVFVFGETYWPVVLLGFFLIVPVDDVVDDDVDDVVDDVDGVDDDGDDDDGDDDDGVDDDDDDDELLFPVSDFFSAFETL